MFFIVNGFKRFINSSSMGKFICTQFELKIKSLNMRKTLIKKQIINKRILTEIKRFCVN